MKKIYILSIALAAIFSLPIGKGGDGLHAQVVSTLAGSTTAGSKDSIGTKASFNQPVGIVADGSGNLYVADVNNNEIRKIVIATGVVTTLAGSTTSGSADSIGSAASFNNPTGITTDGNGNLYVADQRNSEIRKIVIATGAVTTLAGSITPGSADGTGLAAQFNAPSGIVCDGSGNLYVGDAANHEIRKIVISTRMVTTLAGSTTAGSKDSIGTKASFYDPIGITTDGNGNLYVADLNNNEIRKIVISTRAVTTLAGTTTAGSVNGTGAAASFNSPTGVAFDGTGNLFIADGGNNEIRKIVIATGAVTTFAGSTTSGFINGPAAVARFTGPKGVAFDRSGNIYIGDQGNNQIRKITSSPVAYFKTDITNVCIGGMVQFTDTSKNTPTSWKWTFQNGTPATSTAQNPSVVYNTAGTDSVKLVVTNSAGKDSLTKKMYIKVNALPTVTVSGASSLCIGADILTASPVGTKPFAYKWSTAGTNDTIQVKKPNTYSVTVTDSNGCKGTSAGFTVMKDSVPFVRICVVTVDTGSKHNIVVWDKTGVTRMDSFKLYYMNSLSKWQLIKAVPFSAPDYIVDTTSIDNPNNNTVRYCLTGIDSCGNEEHFASSPWQNTMHIISSGGGTYSWSGTGFLKKGVVLPVITYILLRDSLSNGNWKHIDSVSGTQNTMTDSKYASYPKARWRVDALLSDSVSTGCTVPVLRTTAKTYNSSHSNTANSVITGIASASALTSISVYPNPGNGKFQIQISNIEQGISNVEIYNVLGEKVVCHATSSCPSPSGEGIRLQIDISALPDGMYFVRVITNKDAQVVKVVKE